MFYPLGKNSKKPRGGGGGGIPPLYVRGLILMYKVKYNLVPKSISDIFVTMIRNTTYAMWTSLSPDIAQFFYGEHSKYKVSWTLPLPSL